MAARVEKRRRGWDALAQAVVDRVGAGRLNHLHIHSDQLHQRDAGVQDRVFVVRVSRGFETRAPPAAATTTTAANTTTIATRTKLQTPS